LPENSGAWPVIPRIPIGGGGNIVIFKNLYNRISLFPSN
jgi:hypothetical protein